MSICGSYVLWNDIARAEEYNSLVLDELDSMLVPNIVLKCLALEQRNLLRWKRNPLVERKQPVGKLFKKNNSGESAEVREQFIKTKLNLILFNLIF